MHKDFDEEQLEKLLKSLPKVKDHQNADELFERITSRIALEDEEEETVQEIKTTKKKSYIIPVIASIAAVSLLALILPSFFHNNGLEHGAMDSTSEESAKSNQIGTEEHITENSIAEEPKQSMVAEDNQMSMMAELPSHVVHQIPKGSTLVTAAIPDGNIQFVVPLSIVTFNEKPLISQLNDLELNGEQWGLGSFMLENVRFSLNDQDPNSIIIDLPIDHKFNDGSASEKMFLQSVTETVRYLGFKKIEFTVEGKPGVELGNYGLIKELNITEANEKYYLVYKHETKSFLIPIKASTNSIEEAINEMYTGKDIEELEPPLLGEISIDDIESSDESGLLTINFTNETTLPQTEEAVLMVEAILLTAKEFGFEQVQFNFTGIPTLGDYNFLSPIDVPAAPNPIEF